MIKINELRVGNWVEDESGFRQITMGMFAYEAEEGGDEFAVNPIRLTSEILKKAGFEYDDSENEFTINGFVIDFSIHDGVISYNGERLFDENIAETFPFHRIQNLYFALTGEELPVIL